MAEILEKQVGIDIDGDKKPDYTGNGMVNGKKQDFSLWINEDDNGGRYLSGQFKDPYKKKDSPF